MKYLILLVLITFSFTTKAVIKVKNPDRACQFLVSVDLKTSAYRYIEGFGYTCISDYVNIDYFGLSNASYNNISYYVMGDEKSVSQLKLMLNVNDISKQNAAHNHLKNVASLLTLNAVMEVLPQEVEAAILNGESMTIKVGNARINITTESYSKEKYAVNFILE